MYWFAIATTAILNMNRDYGPNNVYVDGKLSFVDTEYSFVLFDDEHTVDNRFTSWFANYLGVDEYDLDLYTDGRNLLLASLCLLSSLSAPAWCQLQ